jgi:hypothetical protein
MNNIKLHEVYIKKYISSKDFSIVLKTAYEDFETVYNDQNTIISKDIDFILCLMKKNEFLGLIRQTIIIYNQLNDKKMVLQEKWKHMLKQDIIRKCLEFDKTFHIYLTASLYSYI